jgi:hypothetical protein
MTPYLTGFSFEIEHVIDLGRKTPFLSYVVGLNPKPVPIIAPACVPVRHDMVLEQTGY